MNLGFIYTIFHNFVIATYEKAELMGPKIIAAVIILFIGAIISYGIYRAVMFIFKKFHIVDLIDRLWEGFEEKTTQAVDKTPDTPTITAKDGKEGKKGKHKSLAYDRISAKALSYYVFLLFFRWSIVILGIIEVETFMNDLIGYLPSLFVGIMIGFFGLRFANSVYDILYQALELTRQKTSAIIAMGAKIIIMFFTLMIMLHYIKIVDQFIINTLFFGFVTTLTLSFSLAFGIGGRDVAKEILESFRK